MGWTGRICDVAVCTNDCGEHGHCIKPDYCECDPTWFSSDVTSQCEMIDIGCTIPTASKATTRSVQSVIGNTSSTQRQTCAVNAAKSTMSTASNVITCSVWSANGRTLFTQTGCRTIDQSQARPGAILKPRPCSQTTRYQTNTWRSTTLSETSLTLSSKNRRSRTKKHRQLKAMRKN